MLLATAHQIYRRIRIIQSIAMNDDTKIKMTKIETMVVLTGLAPN
jgi:hypothetical protein